MADNTEEESEIAGKKDDQLCGLETDFEDISKGSRFTENSRTSEESLGDIFQEENRSSLDPSIHMKTLAVKEGEEIEKGEAASEAGTWRQTNMEMILEALRKQEERLANNQECMFKELKQELVDEWATTFNKLEKYLENVELTHKQKQKERVSQVEMQITANTIEQIKLNTHISDTGKQVVLKFVMADKYELCELKTDNNDQLKDSSILENSRTGEENFQVEDCSTADQHVHRKKLGVKEEKAKERAGAPCEAGEARQTDIEMFLDALRKQEERLEKNQERIFKELKQELIDQWGATCNNHDKCVEKVEHITQEQNERLSQVVTQVTANTKEQIKLNAHLNDIEKRVEEIASKIGETCRANDAKVERRESSHETIESKTKEIIAASEYEQKEGPGQRNVNIATTCDSQMDFTKSSPLNKFNPKGRLHPVKFIQSFKSIMPDTWPEAQKICYVLNFLEGEAATWGEQLEKDGVTYKEFEDAFLANCKSLLQGKSDSVERYAREQPCDLMFARTECRLLVKADTKEPNINTCGRQSRSYCSAAFPQDQWTARCSEGFESSPCPQHVCLLYHPRASQQVRC
ncbi:golgin subfamily A member 6-like protein 6 [Schistocerca gregaria]|uniref:golgin subfamily A member 6-like protein 6 n=1 Tax=Schistocerca gregaria TaxID=7010 RepID=UPI00211EE518|nr:golgin subfamily A member 6-like protein 6 [Schistocerca gregaria]